jgi:hypothetical protein
MMLELATDRARRAAKAFGNSVHIALIVTKTHQKWTILQCEIVIALRAAVPDSNQVFHMILGRSEHHLQHSLCRVNIY